MKNGSLWVFNYEEKKLLWKENVYCGTQKKVKATLTCVKFSPSGLHLASGLSNGCIWCLTHRLSPAFEKGLYHNFGAIKLLRYSMDNKYLAAADSERYVTLYQVGEVIKYIGSYRSHYKPINDLLFYPYDGKMTLFSIGNDRNLVQYNLEQSTHDEELVIERIDRIGQIGIPLCLDDYPMDEDNILFSNSEFKYCVLNLRTKNYVRVSQAPVMSHPINKIKLLPNINKNPDFYYIFTTGENMGIQKGPIDGNLYKSITMRAASDDVLEICTSYDGVYIFTLGKNDNCVHMWEVDIKAVDIFEHLGGTGLQPYFCMLAGGEFGSEMEALKDNFILSLILNQGDILTERTMTCDLPLCELSNALRAMGYFPSKYELENILREISYQCKSEESILNYKISFTDFVKLYINYRPVFGTTEEMLSFAFQTIIDVTSKGNEVKSSFSRLQLLPLLEQAGECLTKQEIISYLNSLIFGDKVGTQEEEKMPILHEDITYEYLWKDLLGLLGSPSKPTAENNESNEDKKQ